MGINWGNLYIRANEVNTECVVYMSHREYANMASVRYIDFDSPERVHRKPRSTIRSKPELIETEPVH